MRETTVDLAVLSSGDRVAWLEKAGYGDVLAVMATVERTTPTQFVVRTDDRGLYRFSRKNGEMIGNGRWGPCLQDPLDGQVVNAVAAQRARKALRAIEALGRTKVQYATDALGMLRNASLEIYAATQAIEALLGRMDRAQAKRKMVSDVRADQRRVRTHPARADRPAAAEPQPLRAQAQDR